MAIISIRSLDAEDLPSGVWSMFTLARSWTMVRCIEDPSLPHLPRCLVDLLESSTCLAEAWFSSLGILSPHTVRLCNLRCCFAN